MGIPLVTPGPGWAALVSDAVPLLPTPADTTDVNSEMAVAVPAAANACSQSRCRMSTPFNVRVASSDCANVFSARSAASLSQTRVNTDCPSRGCADSTPIRRSTAACVLRTQVVDGWADVVVHVRAGAPGEEHARVEHRLECAHRPGQRLLRNLEELLQQCVGADEELLAAHDPPYSRLVLACGVGG